jgi:exopolyphosphatase/guanosine-5'-triphosphate,3'-diphosphate pyrophosphatase
MKRIGIIDLGSNTARLLVANIYDNGGYRVIDQIKESVRLSEEMTDDNILRPKRVRQTIQTLQMFKRLCECNGVEQIVAVATAAVRRARNQRSFIDEVKHATGIELQVLSGEEESYYVYLGAINSLDFNEGVIMDLGGGSFEIIYVEKRRLMHSVTIPYGAVTLTEKFALQDKVTPEQLANIENFVREQLDEQAPWLKKALEKNLPIIGIGGSMRNLGKISRKKERYPLDMNHNYPIKVETARSIYEHVKGLDLDRRMRIPGLSNERADIFTGALATIVTVAEYINAPEIVVGTAGLREGILYAYAMPNVKTKPLEDMLETSLLNELSYFNMNIPHAKQVYKLALSMFDQLRSLHKLPASYRRILKTAAYMHDVGSAIRYYDHHRHSYYLIMHTNIYGLTHREQVMAAFIAAAHRKQDRPRDWARFKGVLEEGDPEIIAKLGVLVRIAESFDRTMSGAVEDVACDVLGDSVIMKTQAKADVSLEIKDALTSSFYFKRAYGKNLVIL